MDGLSLTSQLLLLQLLEASEVLSQLGLLLPNPAEAAREAIGHPMTSQNKKEEKEEEKEEEERLTEVDNPPVDDLEAETEVVREGDRNLETVMPDLLLKLGERKGCCVTTSQPQQPLPDGVLCHNASQTSRTTSLLAPKIPSSPTVKHEDFIETTERVIGDTSVVVHKDSLVLQPQQSVLRRHHHHNCNNDTNFSSNATVGNGGDELDAWRQAGRRLRQISQNVIATTPGSLPPASPRMLPLSASSARRLSNKVNVIYSDPADVVDIGGVVDSRGGDWGEDVDTVAVSRGGGVEDAVVRGPSGGSTLLDVVVKLVVNAVVYICVLKLKKLVM